MVCLGFYVLPLVSITLHENVLYCFSRSRNILPYFLCLMSLLRTCIFLLGWESSTCSSKPASSNVQENVRLCFLERNMRPYDYRPILRSLKPFPTTQYDLCYKIHLCEITLRKLSVEASTFGYSFIKSVFSSYFRVNGM